MEDVETYSEGHEAAVTHTTNDQGESTKDQGDTSTRNVRTWKRVAREFQDHSGIDTITGLFNRFCILCWSIWNQRNITFHGGHAKSVEEIISSAGDLLSEYQNTCKALSVVSKPVEAAARSWSHPPPGCLKLNTDVSVKTGKDFIGIGAAIRDSSGKPPSRATEIADDSPRIDDGIAIGFASTSSSICSLASSILASSAAGGAGFFRQLHRRRMSINRRHRFPAVATMAVATIPIYSF
ncbi:hypothetical protein Q3G72_018010 [Acer saccharum]|nr:hypothetical protein Q3G72_018010 [Acer saccharum]